MVTMEHIGRLFTLEGHLVGAAAVRLLAETDLTEDRRVVLAYRRMLGRRPTPEELDGSLKFIESLEVNGQASNDKVEAAGWSVFIALLE